ncbi:hypothetical protein GCM10023196_036720 [Actinoallomurus vinaceus]|uniref:Uncharacterized protein n=1 Tax=Actinoallomurus vinaceus TaxID=1080074 RepID=A0ABP8U967_9ACTN
MDVASIITAFSLPATGFIYLLILIELVLRATRQRRYSWGRHIERASTDLSLSLFHAPMISASSAAAAGVGINFITDSNASVAKWAWGMFLVTASPIILAGGSVRLIRKATDRRGGLALARYRLARCIACRTVPSDYAEALAWTRRMQQVASRFAVRAQSLTFRTWARRDHPRAVTIVSIAWGLNAVAVSAAFLGLCFNHGRIRDLRDAAVLLAYCGGLVLAPAALVLWWRTEQWWLAAVGAELQKDAVRAEAALVKLSPADGVRLRLWRWVNRHRPSELSGPVLERRTR